MLVVNVVNRHETKEIKVRGNTIRYNFPAHSLTQLLIPVR